MPIAAAFVRGHRPHAFAQFQRVAQSLALIVIEGDIYDICLLYPDGSEAGWINIRQQVGFAAPPESRDRFRETIVPRVDELVWI